MFSGDVCKNIAVGGAAVHSKPRGGSSLGSHRMAVGYPIDKGIQCDFEDIWVSRVVLFLSVTEFSDSV